MAKLSEDEIQDRVSNLEGWVLKDNCLYKEFKFEDFASAMAFMNALAPVAEKLNHHPDWSNSYNKVSIKLTTHSEGGLTDMDFKFAEAADKAYSQ